LNGTYYDYEAMLALKEKELFLDAVEIEFFTPPPKTSETPVTEEAIKEGLMVLITSMIAGTHLLTRLHPELSTEECIKQAVNYLQCIKAPDGQTMQELITPDLEKILRDGNFSLAQMSELLNKNVTKEYYCIAHKGVIIGHVKHTPTENWQEKLQETYKEIRLCILGANTLQTNAFGNQTGYRAKVKAVPCTKQEYKESCAFKSSSFLDLHTHLQALFAHLTCYAVCLKGSSSKQYVYCTRQELSTEYDPYECTTIVSIDKNKTLVGRLPVIYKNIATAEACAKPNGRIFSSLEKLFAFYHYN
jgi:hypothetical protein